MHAKRLAIRNYRNYEGAEIAPCEGITVLHGANAQGKTGILEAIYLCCTGRSHRTSKDKELIRWEQPEARVQLCVERTDGSHEIDIHLPAMARKQVFLNGTLAQRTGELMGHANGVLFSPEDLRMVKEGPAERRRFVDMELSQIRPAYYYALQRYHRALTQRNAVLRDAQRTPSLLGTLDEWDEQLAQCGAQIMGHRRGFVARLHQTASDVHAGITGGRERLQVDYAPSLVSESEGDRLSEDFLRALRAARSVDLRRQTTTVGPHRDDVALYIDGVDARAYASQGQQRTCALSLKLSELNVMREATGEWPILMLDDVMSELDPERRRQLFGRLSGIQTLVTCTDPEDLAGATVGMMVHIEKGVVTHIV